MTLEVETLVAVALILAVFSAVAAVGTSIVLGAGFERLRAGFEVIRNQTGFFSDALRKLEMRVDTIDRKTECLDEDLRDQDYKPEEGPVTVHPSEVYSLADYASHDRVPQKKAVRH